MVYKVLFYGTPYGVECIDLENNSKTKVNLDELIDVHELYAKNPKEFDVCLNATAFSWLKVANIMRQCGLKFSDIK